LSAERFKHLGLIIDEENDRRVLEFICQLRFSG
jgi:hypothetical protein